MHLQCDVIQCYGRCVEIDDCNDVALAGFGKGTNGPGNLVQMRRAPAWLEPLSLCSIPPRLDVSLAAESLGYL